MKGVILSINPDAGMIDVTHSVPAQNIRRAAAIVAEIASTFPEQTVHLAVVDPGVGSSRPLLAAEAANQRFLAPDNGLLEALFRRYPPQRIHRLTESQYWRRPVSATFHGRDILAPVAAHWSLDVDIARFGPPLDAGDLVSLVRPIVRREPDALIGEIESIDAFGNCISNISEADLPTDCARPQILVEIAGRMITGICRCYADQLKGTALALVGSSGLLEVAVAQGDAAQTLDVEIGTEIRVYVARGNQ